jgi:hypothetical protein
MRGKSRFFHRIDELLSDDMHSSRVHPGRQILTARSRSSWHRAIAEQRSEANP